MECTQVEIISSEIITASRAVSPHLKTYKLCLFDQMSSVIYMPQVFFYQTQEAESIVDRLKESLSKALSLFYPLSGRLSVDGSSMDCNNRGVLFTEARVKGSSLLSFLQAPDRINSVHLFLPSDVYKDTELIPLVVQVSVFDYGGLAIGFQGLHKIIDGASWGGFLKTWATFATNSSLDVEDVSAPDLATAVSLFPPCSHDMPSKSVVKVIRSFGDDGCIVKAFSFNPQDIALLQNMAKSERVPNPTRIEAVSAFIWKHASTARAAAVLGKASSPTRSVLFHAVNIRPWTDPQLPLSAMGNLVTNAIAQWDLGQNPEEEIADLVAGIRSGISQVKDPNFLSTFQGEQGTRAIRDYSEKQATLCKDPNTLNTYKFTSWSRRDLGVDFGFGEPVWIAYFGGRNLSSTYRNLIPLIGTVDYRIEAWLGLNRQEMALLESDSQFLRFASLLN